MHICGFHNAESLGLYVPKTTANNIGKWAYTSAQVTKRSWQFCWHWFVCSFIAHADIYRSQSYLVSTVNIGKLCL
jgi:hypothetical protein